jgi:glycosyltransferase involved in cell wall biosynthesis
MSNHESAASKTRLLILASTYPRWAGDPEPGFVHELARRLTADFEVRVVAPHARGASLSERLDGVEVIRFRYAPVGWETLVNEGGIIANLRRAPWKWLLVPPFLIAGVIATWRAIETHQPDVIHAHWLIPQGLAVAFLSLLRKQFPPVVVTSHGADLFALRGSIAAALKRFVIRRASQLTTVSAAMREELLTLGAEPTRVHVLPMGVDMRDRFTPDPSVSRAPEEILFVGRLVEKKGLRYLIEAMPAILAARPGVILRVAGFGPERAALEARAAELGIADRVVFLGAVAQVDLPGLYRRATVFVAPFVQASSGDQEGLGLVTIEAIACGCPVVCSDLPATRDVIGTGGVRPADPKALAAAVLRVLETSEAEARRQAASLRERLMERFDWSAVARAYAALLKTEVRCRLPAQFKNA